MRRVYHGYCIHRNFPETCLECNPSGFKWVQSGDLAWYLSDLKLSRKDLANRMILDVGAGERNFARGILRERIRATVVSLEPEFADRSRRKFLEGVSEFGISPQKRGENKLLDRRTVAGLATALPFRSRTFHLVLMYRVFQWLPSLRAMEIALREVVRVLKVGGEARIVPFGAVGRYQQEILEYQKQILPGILGKRSRIQEISSGTYLLRMKKHGR